MQEDSSSPAERTSSKAETPLVLALFSEPLDYSEGVPLLQPALMHQRAEHLFQQRQTEIVTSVVKRTLANSAQRPLLLG